MWGAKKIYASNDEVMEIEDIENLNSPKVFSKKHSSRIDDDSEIGNISRLGITGRRKRFPNRVKFSATHVVPAKIGTKLWFLKALKRMFPESSLIESDQVPYFHIAVMCICFYFVFVGVGIFFGYATYMDMRTSYFLSLGGNQSLPGTTMTVQECWEVPRTLTGQFYGDSNGFWSTRGLYDPSKTMFGITATILKITTTQWQIAMNAAVKKMKAVTARSIYRDLAWNLIMFSSFYVTIHGPLSEDFDGNTIPGGTLDFYVAADADILLGRRRIVSATFANQFHGICDPANIDSYFDNGDKSFVFQFKLCNMGFCKPDHRNSDFKYEYISRCPNWYADVDTDSSNGKNDGSTYTPTGGSSVSLNTVAFQSNSIFDPQQFGYIYGTMKHNYFELRVDSRSLTLALAVNYGILAINDLTKMTKTEKLKEYLTNLARQQVITIAEANTIYPFYDPKFAPMDPIYCMLFPGVGGGPASVEMPNFNEGDFVGDDVALMDYLYDDDSVLNAKDDDTAHIKFGGPTMDIYSLPKKVFVSYQFTLQNYDITKIGTTSSTSSNIDSDKATLTTAIKSALTTAFNAYNGPLGGLKGAIDTNSVSIWYFNNDPENYSGTQNFDPGNFNRRLQEDDKSLLQNEVDNQQQQFSLLDKFRRVLQGPPPPPPPPPAPVLSRTTTSVDTVVTFGFKFDPNGSKADTFYHALQDLSQLISECTFITELNSKIQATTPTNFRNTLVTNADVSANMVIDSYSLILDTFFVTRRPDEGQSDDIVKKKPPRNDDLIGDDYFGDDAIPPDPNARKLEDLDANIKLSDYRMRTRDRILKVASEFNRNNYRRKLKPVEPPIPKINNNTGATCFIMAEDTFMYPIMSHFGQAGTSRCECMKNTGVGSPVKWAKDDDCYAAAVLGLDNNLDELNTGSTDYNAGKYYYKTCYRGSTPPPPPPPGAQFAFDHHEEFPFLPKICDEKDGHKDSCENFDLNVGLIFYPGVVDPRDNKLKPNGQIFSFGQSVYQAIIQSPETGDLDIVNSAYDAMSMISAAAGDYVDLHPQGVPGDSGCADSSSGTTVHSTTCYGRKYIKKYSLERWNKAFQQVCGSTGCSMFNFHLRDKVKTPSMNIYDYRSKESPSYRNVLVDETVLEKLIDNVPTQFIEIFYQCVSTVSNAWMTSIGVGNSNADFFASVSFTTLIILTIFHLRYRRTKNKTVHYSHDQEKELDDAAEKYRDQMMIDAIELLVSKEKSRCGSDDPDFQNMEKALDSIYKIDDKEYDVQWEYEDEQLEHDDEEDEHK